MWSKQADTNNKQVTSFKNKISHRKRKNEKSKNAQATNNDANANKPAKKGDKNKQKTNNKIISETVAPDLIEDIKQTRKDDVNKLADLATADVCLRKASDTNKQKLNDINNTVKRYSDSFVADNAVNHNDTTNLSRAHSGSVDLSIAETCEKKPRRFSDLFRPSSASKSNIDSVQMKSHFLIDDNGLVISEPVPLTKTKSDKSSIKRTESIKSGESAKSQKSLGKTPANAKKPTVKFETPNNSVLKRVKSKIYKSKCDSGVSRAPSMPDISENVKKVKKDDKAEEVRKTNPFEFRLIRQSSNLECIRPNILSHKKTQSVDGIIINEKPILAKSKSNSAINLNLLRNRRNSKLTDSKKTCKEVQDEFDFIAFGGLNNNLNKSVLVARKFGSQDLTSNINNNVNARRTSWVGITPGDAKPGNPVARTPSDRRPDAVREESRTQDISQTHDHDNDTTNPESSVSLPASTGNKKRHTNINRSESVKEQSEKNRKQRRNVSDPLHTTNETVDLDQQGQFHHHSGSSSNSSLSSRSLESPSSNADAVSDSDLEVDDLPDWKRNVSEEQLSSLHPDEKKRQDVINELFHTERSHVRNLKVLEKVFRRNIVQCKVLTEPEQKLVFANLVDILSIHNQFNSVMKNKRKENHVVGNVADILLNMFDGEMGNNYCNAAAKFCEKQHQALEFIKEKRKKDSKFESVITNCEKENICRRLPFQGFLPHEMQRLSKYPLLLERLINCEQKPSSDSCNAELDKLKLALEKSKQILNRVNEAAKLAYNKSRLEDIKNHLESGNFERQEHFNEFKNFDLATYTLIHEGTITLKRQNKNPLQVHMLLLEEAVILLQKEGERYTLKFFHASNQVLSPIIRMSNVICRKNAADFVTLFLVSNAANNSQMYEIQCRDASERKMWFKYLTDATEPYKLRDGKGKRTERTHDPEEETVQDLPASRPETSERAETSVSGDTENAAAVTATNTSDSNNRLSDHSEDDRAEKRLSQHEIPAVQTAGDGVSIKLTANEWPLIQPSEVQVAIPPVHTAEPVLTPLEQIKRKDEEVKQALDGKKKLVADLLEIHEDDYESVAEMASEEAVKKSPSERDPSELVLASVYQVDQLLTAVNDSLNVSETDSILTTGGKHPSCASNETIVKQNMPSVPVHKLQEIATTLSSQLTILLSVVKEREEEREKLRKEMHRMREQLHEKSNLHGPQNTDSETQSQLDSTQSGDLESIEESPTETETT